VSPYLVPDFDHTWPASQYRMGDLVRVQFPLRDNYLVMLRLSNRRSKSRSFWKSNWIDIDILAGICNWFWLTAILAKTTHCESSDSYIAHLTGTPAVWPSLAPNKIEIELTSNSSHHYIYLYRNQPLRPNQPGHPFVGRHCEYQPKGGNASLLGSIGRFI